MVELGSEGKDAVAPGEIRAHRDGCFGRGQKRGKVDGVSAGRVSALNPGRVGRRAFLSFAAFQLDFAAQARARRGHPWVAYRKSPSNNVEDYVSQGLFASQAIDIALILTDPH
jgi:hypothetical protein